MNPKGVAAMSLMLVLGAAALFAVSGVPGLLLGWR